jgi:hypothetical protein
MRHTEGYKGDLGYCISIMHSLIRLLTAVSVSSFNMPSAHRGASHTRVARAGVEASESLSGMWQIL